MSFLQTVKIAVEKTAENMLGYVVINLEDFDEKIHTLFGLSEEAAKLQADAAKAAQDLKDQAAAEAARVLEEAEAVKAKLAQDAQKIAQGEIDAEAARIAQQAKDAIAAEIAKATGTAPAVEPAPVVTQPWMVPPAV
jgi:hypothetical protein